MKTSLHTSGSRFQSGVTLLMFAVIALVGSAQNAWGQEQQKPQPKFYPPTPVYWDSDGENIFNVNPKNVGVGTNKPEFMFDVMSPDTVVARFSSSSDHAQILVTAPTGFNANLTLLQSDIPQWSLGNRASNNRFGITEASGTTEVFSILQNGRVGVGTVAPGFRFDVQGGQINASGGLCIAGDCKTAWSQVGGGTSQWTTTGSNIYYNAGNVGIGTTNPIELLHTYSPSGVTVSQFQAGSGSAGYAGLWDQGGFLFSNNRNPRTGNNFNSTAVGGQFSIGNSGDGNRGDFAFSTTSNGTTPTVTELVRIKATGKVGVGTASPGYRLDVQGGQINSSGGLCISGDCKTAWSQIGSQWTTSGSNINYTAGNVGIGTANPGRPLVVTADASGIPLRVYRNINNVGWGTGIQWAFNNSSGNVTDYAYVNSSIVSNTAGAENGTLGFFTAKAGTLTQQAIIDHNGNLGIGTGGPGYRLDVQGGQINSSGGLCIGGDCKTAWSQVGGSSQWTTTGSNISYSTGNVGIGTTTPDSNAKLHLSGSGGFGQDIQTTTADWTRLRFVTPTRTWGFFLDGGSAGLGAGKFGLFDYTANAWRMVTDTSGNVGIGTTTPNKSSVSKAMTVNGSADAIYELAIADTRKGNMYHDGTNLSVTNNANGALTLGTNNSERLRIDASGNVGIGTAPTAKRLEVSGDLNASGTITGGNIQAKYQDVAEWVESSQSLAAGTVVVLDQTKSNQVIASLHAYDTRVAGVVSARPGITLGEKGESRVLVATTGRVKVKVDATAGPIQIGDLLVTSEIEGVAKKSEPLNLGGVQIHRPGTLIGKALEPLAKGTGEILVLLSLQ